MARWTSPFRRRAIPALATCLALATAAGAQPAPPRIGYIYPAGGRQGTEFEVSIGGRWLNRVSAVEISGPGVRATVVEHLRPVFGKGAAALREELKKLRQKRAAAGKGGPGGSKAATKPAWTDEDKNRAVEILKTLVESKKKLANPAIAETVVIQVTVDASAEPGRRELRLVGRNGLSNPLAFCVGRLPEIRETQSTSSDVLQILRRFTGGRAPQAVAREAEMKITLPAVINGQIMPGDVDRYRFQARKGQRLVVAASARELIPYLADAVPGWFQAVIVLYDAKGNELAFADDFRFHPDPVLYHEIPEDGEYVVEIRDAIYRGREDFVYRIALGELPFVTSIFPLGGKVGAKTTVALTGWNLPVPRLTWDAGDRHPGVYPLCLGKGRWALNPMPFAADTLPECLEQEPNDRQGKAQRVTSPLIVNGRIDKAGDCDVFAFEGRAGNKIVAEVLARRLNSPMDSALKLTDATGRQLAFNDDAEDKGAGMTTHHADSRLMTALPADGIYYLHLRDAQHKGGPEYAYRLRIGPPRPDFALRVVPASITLRGRASAVLTVYALRKDGFSDEIVLALKDAPAGFTLSGGRVPAGHDKMRMTLTAPATPQKDPVSLRLEGRAPIQGRQVVRPAVPAEDMMQAFIYRHLVPAQELSVVVAPGGGRRRPVRILGETPVRIPAGGTARLQVAVPTKTPLGALQLALHEPPKGISIASVSPIRRATEIVLRSDAGKVKPGLEGNLIVNVFLQRAPAPGKDKAPKTRRRIPLGALPAIPFKITAK